jgi:hypothetical protein
MNLLAATIGGFYFMFLTQDTKKRLVLFLQESKTSNDLPHTGQRGGGMVAS